MLSQTGLSTNRPRLRIPIIKMKVVRGGYSYSDNPVITDSGSAFRFIHPYFEGHDREEMVALMLNAKHRMLGLHTISIGSAQFSIVHPRETLCAVSYGMVSPFQTGGTWRNVLGSTAYLEGKPEGDKSMLVTQGLSRRC